MPAEQGQGMTMEWCTVEDWRLCQQDKRKQKKTEEGGGFISITSGMPRTFLEWHVLRHQAWQEHTHFIGFIKETRGGTSRIWDVVGVCLSFCACLHACMYKWTSAFMCAFGCLHVWGLRGGILGFSGCVEASSPTTLTCLHFGLSAL